MTGKLLQTYKKKITGLKLIPAGGGAFELLADGEQVYSKLDTGQFPDEEAIVDAIGARLKN